MRIGLIDVDSHNFPNLALMRISAYHKAQGDDVEWWFSDFDHYDIIYKSKTFSETYTEDTPDPVNCDRLVKGGTGYAIETINGVEVFDRDAPVLPPEMESMFPDYSIYPQYDYAVAMLTRGCPNNCAFCHVCSKEGRASRKVANVSDFYAGQQKIAVLDANILACHEKRDLFRQLLDTKAYIDFSQGLDIRLLNDEDIDDLNHMRIKWPHFSWDNPDEDLEPFFTRFSEDYHRKAKGMVYVLTNFNPSSLEDDIERALYRIYILHGLGYDPYVMIYDKPNAPHELKQLARWCNNKWVFKKCPIWDDYNVSLHGKKYVQMRMGAEVGQ